MKWLRNPVTWGAGLLVFAGVISLVIGMLYLSPPSQRIVAFYTSDAATLHPGDQVRIAGIPVGAVKDLELEQDRVRVRAQIDDTAFVGDDSQVQVRMLTVVGGYYVSILPLGDHPLGSNVIPLERVTMPYNLVQALTEATKITDNIRPEPINESLAQIQQGLSGDNSQVLSAVVDFGNTLMSTFDRQRGQMTAILELSDEYIESLKGYREELRQLVHKAAIIEQVLVLYGKGFAAAMKGLGEMGNALKPVGEFYMDHRDEFLEKTRNWLEKARIYVERNGIIVRGLHRIQDKINRVLDAQNARPELLATDLCIPLPGVPC